MWLSQLVPPQTKKAKKASKKIVKKKKTAKKASKKKIPAKQKKSAGKKIKKSSPKQPHKKLSSSEGQAKIEEIIKLGKEKGFITFDEVNNMLEDYEVSLTQMDEVFALLGDNDVRYIDKEDASEIKVGSKPERTQQEAVASPPTHTTDPIKMYLKEMREIPLLTHEEEIALAMKIEAAENRLRDTVFEIGYALKEVNMLKDKIKNKLIDIDEFFKEKQDFWGEP